MGVRTAIHRFFTREPDFFGLLNEFLQAMVVASLTSDFSAHDPIHLGVHRLGQVTPSPLRVDPCRVGKSTPKIPNVLRESTENRRRDPP